MRAPRLRVDETNHVHLLLTPKKASALLPKLIISLGRRYVQYVNRSYRRTGTLWDSRYKSSVIRGTRTGDTGSGLYFAVEAIR